MAKLGRTVRQTLIKGLVGLGLIVGVVSVVWLTPPSVITSVITADDSAIDRERRERFRTVSLGRALDGTPDLASLDTRLAAHGIGLGAPIFMRIFKREFELELWMKRDGRFHRFATYPICRYSGGLGPKLREGDKQAPEGIYTVGPKQLNPNSQWHRAFNLGFPNSHDAALGRTGSFVMVHGGCSSVGCFAMTDAVVDELWQIVTAALGAGQARFQLQVFPFRMTAENFAARKDSPWLPFWQDLKTVHDAFDQTLLPPKVNVCDGRYVVSTSSDTATDGRHEITQRCEPTPPGRAAALSR
jgi:murein L,D-transpeptidase YafK